MSSKITPDKNTTKVWLRLINQGKNHREHSSSLASLLASLLGLSNYLFETNLFEWLLNLSQFFEDEILQRFVKLSQITKLIKQQVWYFLSTLPQLHGLVVLVSYQYSLSDVNSQYFPLPVFSPCFITISLWKQVSKLCSFLGGNDENVTHLRLYLTSEGCSLWLCSSWLDLIPTL